MEVLNISKKRPSPINLTTFSALPGPPWQTFIRGAGDLLVQDGALQFINAPTSCKQYSNAQLDDYQPLSRANFLWRPPLKLTVEAKFSHPTGSLSGTAGFGFWNDPFMMTGLRRPALPRAIWFFYASPPSNMKLDLETPGYGWKAATIDALRPAFFALAPLSPLAVPLMNINWLYRLCWPIGQRAMQVSERLLEADMTTWHTYQLTWLPDRAEFQIDNQLVLSCSTTPRGPLGFVMWFDNQYMVVTPWGKLKHGLLSTAAKQSMSVQKLIIEPLPP